jgi:hypothetical protein
MANGAPFQSSPKMSDQDQGFSDRIRQSHSDFAHPSTHPFTLTLTIFSSPQAAWTTAKTSAKKSWGGSYALFNMFNPPER